MADGPLRRTRDLSQWLLREGLIEPEKGMPLGNVVQPVQVISDESLGSVPPIPVAEFTAGGQTPSLAGSRSGVEILTNVPTILLEAVGINFNVEVLLYLRRAGNSPLTVSTLNTDWIANGVVFPDYPGFNQIYEGTGIGTNDGFRLSPATSMRFEPPMILQPGMIVGLMTVSASQNFEYGLRWREFPIGRAPAPPPP